MEYKVTYPKENLNTSGLAVIQHLQIANTPEYNQTRDPALSDKSGLPIVSVERPWPPMRSAFAISSDKAPVEDYETQLLHGMDKLAVELGKHELNSYIHLGNSSGGTSAAIVAAEHDTTAGAVILEPAGRSTAASRYSRGDDKSWPATFAFEHFRYVLTKEKPKTEKQTDDEALGVKPLAPPVSELAKRIPAELLKHRRIWSTDISIRALEKIAKERPDMPVSVGFAEKTFGFQEGDAQRLCDDLESYAKQHRGEDEALFHASVDRDRFHSSYDKIGPILPHLNKVVSDIMRR